MDNRDNATGNARAGAVMSEGEGGEWCGGRWRWRAGGEDLYKAHVIIMIDMMIGIGKQECFPSLPLPFCQLVANVLGAQ